MEPKKRILVVEDDTFLRDIYVEVLTTAGFEVQFAENGQVGLDKIKEGNWDLVFLDIIMPIMSGVDVIKQLNDPANPLPQKPYKKLVFMTNLDSDKEIKEALAMSDGYIIKSQMTPGDIIEKAKSYLQ